MLQVLPPSDMLTAPDVKSSNLMEYVETLRDRTGGVIDARIWRAVKGERNHFDPPAGPCVLRVELRDTFFVYLTVAAEGSEGLRARKAVVFGLHEKVCVDRLPSSRFLFLSLIISFWLEATPSAFRIPRIQEAVPGLLQHHLAEAGRPASTTDRECAA